MVCLSEMKTLLLVVFFYYNYFIVTITLRYYLYEY